MVSKLLTVIACLLLTTEITTALRCYMCVDSASSDCAKAKSSSMSIQECNSRIAVIHGIQTFFNSTPHINTNYDVCLELIAADFKPKLFLRSCVMFSPDTDPCDFLKNLANVTACRSCKTDLCNQKVKEDDPVMNMIL